MKDELQIIVKVLEFNVDQLEKTLLEYEDLELTSEEKLDLKKKKKQMLELHKLIKKLKNE